MTNKETKISMNKIKEIVKAEAKEPLVICYPMGDRQVDITIKKSLEKDDKVRLISEVVNGCFDGDTYQPYYKSDLFKIAVLEYFTNIKVNADENVLFQLVTNTGVYDTVSKEIANVVQDLSAIVDDMIEYRKQETLCTQKQTLETTIKTLEQYVDQIITIGSQFKDIDPIEMMTLAKAIAEKDEHALSKAVIELRTNTTDS